MSVPRLELAPPADRPRRRTIRGPSGVPRLELDDPPARRAPAALWQVYLVLGSILSLLYLSVPPFQGNVRLLEGLEVSGITAVVVGIMRHRPRARGVWLMFAFGLALFWIGHFYTFAYPRLDHVALTFPSVGDAVSLIFYPVLAVTLLRLVRRRSRVGSSGAELIDSLIMTLGFGLLLWIFLIGPYVAEHHLALTPKLVRVAYPFGDMVVLVAVIRLALDSGTRRPTFHLLLAGAACLIATDIAAELLTLHGAHHQGVLDVGWAYLFLLWGAAALHPSMRSIDQGEPMREKPFTRLRLTLLTSASLISPVIEITRDLTRGSIDLHVTIEASVVLFGLVVLRMAGLVRQREQSVTRERTLNSAGAMLVAASSRDEVVSAAIEAVHSLIDGEVAVRLGLGEGDRISIFGDSEEEPGQVSSWRLPAGALPKPPMVGLEALTLEEDVRSWLRLLDHPEQAVFLTLPAGRAGIEGVLIVAGDLGMTAPAMSGLRTLASQVALALESAAASEEAHRRESETLITSLVRNSSDLITVLDAEATIIFQTPSIERVLGYRPEEVVGQPFSMLLHPSEHGRLLRRLLDGGLDRDQLEPIDCALRNRDGELRHFEIVYNNMLEDGVVHGIVLNGRDVSERKAFEEQLAHQAFHDPVTHLANRALFNERVRHAVARSLREGIGVAVIFMDLDDFKIVNDSLGHAAGDRVLLEVSQRLEASIRAGDTAARFGGDEFAVLLEDIEGPQEAAEIAERILAAVAQPMHVGDTDLVVRSSLGLSVAEPGAPSDAEELIRNADAAMYIAKGDGKGGYRLFEPAMHEHVLARLEMRGDLQRALAEGQFELYFQPVVRLDDGHVSAVEALIRWHHPTRGLTAPDAFIPLAEESGLIVPLGRWVLREGCQRLQEIRRSAGVPELSVCINLSVKQLFRGDIVDDVRAALDDSGLEPGSLTLEITESVMMTDLDTAVTRLGQLKEIGVRLAMDDFGTGYSSLSYLSRFPIDTLKMDRSLLGAGASPITSGLATAVLGLGETFAVDVVAEGIEYAEQCSTLRDLGCELGQGYYFARPMQQDALATFLRERSADAEPPLAELPQRSAA